MASYSDTPPWGRATFAELIGTALLAVVVFGVVDRRAVLFDATVNWSQLPAYLVGEFGGGEVHA